MRWMSPNEPSYRIDARFGMPERFKTVPTSWRMLCFVEHGIMPNEAQRAVQYEIWMKRWGCRKERLLTIRKIGFERCEPRWREVQPVEGIVVGILLSFG